MGMREVEMGVLLPEDIGWGTYHILRKREVTYSQVLAVVLAWDFMMDDSWWRDPDLFLAWLLER